MGTYTETNVSYGKAATAAIEAEKHNDYATARRLSDELGERIGTFSAGGALIYRTASIGATTPDLTAAVASWASWYSVYLEARDLAKHIVDVSRKKDGSIVVRMDDGHSACYDDEWIEHHARIDATYYVCDEYRVRARAIKYAMRNNGEAE